jgi:tRNA G18 (ribose-2'-O)-methylase SpoU
MRVERVQDLAREELADYLHLTDVALRRKLEPAGGLYIAESTKVLARALEAGHRPRTVLVQEKWLGGLGEMLSAFPQTRDLPVYVAPDEVIQQITGFHVHRGALAAMHRPKLPEVTDLVATARRIVVLEDIVDHTNVGAIFRSAAGLGADAVLVTPRCADPLYRRSVRVSMGTVFQVPWTRLPGWPEGARVLHAAGFRIAALALRPDAVPLEDYCRTAPDKVALMLGTEGDGLSADAVGAADTVVRIPMMHGVDSLNVAASSAVAMWALRVRT